MSRYRPAASGTIAAVTRDANGITQPTRLAARPAGAAGAAAGRSWRCGSCRRAPQRGGPPCHPDRQHRDDGQQREQPREHGPLRAERARPGEPVTAERRREQAVAQQRVRGAAHRVIGEQAVHDAEERQLEQQRQAATEHAGPLGPVQGAQFFLQALRVPGVPPLQLGDLGLQPGPGSLAPDRAADREVGQRQQEQPDGHGERDDRRRGGQAAQQRGQDRGDPADEVIREIDRNAKDSVAKEQGHDGAPSSGPESDDSWRRPPGRPAPPGAGRR